MHCPDIFVGAVYTADELVAPPDVAVEPELVEAEPLEDPPERPPLVHMKPITEAQEEWLKRLLREARADGMGAEMLRAILDELGMGSVRITAGWVRGLSREEASRLIKRLARGREQQLAPEPDIEL
jgi:hypothetical protein